MENEKKELMDAEGFVEDIAEKVKNKVKKLPRIVIFVLVAALVMSAVWGYIGWQRAELIKKDQIIEEQRQTIQELIDKGIVTVTLVDKKLQAIGELATLEYYYKTAAEYENFKHLFSKPLDFTKSYYIVQWDGIIKAGIDFEKVTKGVNPLTKTITIGIPDAQILSHDPNEENVKVLELKENILNPISVEEVLKFDAVSKAAVEEDAIKDGILEKAKENAKKVIQNAFFSDEIMQGYTIKFVDRKR